MRTPSPTQLLVFGLLQAMALSFRLRPGLRRLLRGADGWIDFSVGFRTEQGDVDAGITFEGGRARAHWSAPPCTDCVMVFRDADRVARMLRVTPNEILNMMLRSELRTEGDLSYLSLFNHLLATLLGESQRRREAKRRAAVELPVEPLPAAEAAAVRADLKRRSGAREAGEAADPGVKYLADPHLAHLSLEDFPRLARFLDIHFQRRPEISAERARLVTEWHRENGLDTDRTGAPWDPRLRQAEVFRHLMERRRPIIREGDLLAGTTTDKEIGVVLYPDAHGALIWGELSSLPERELNPYDVADADAELLHHEVFPYWSGRTFRELVRREQGAPLCQQLDERFAVYFIWKTVGISHTIPDFPSVLSRGTRGMAAEVQAALDRDDDPLDDEGRSTCQAMLITLQGVEAYAANLSRQAATEAAAEADPRRRAELERLSEICARVPCLPARSLDEAVNAVWMVWVAMHMENTNTGLSLGRLDQWLQPYFEADMAAAKTDEEREALARRAVELCGCLFMRCTDHLPLVPDIGNYLFGGSSSDQAITLGGVSPEGEDAVNDMTYVLLKVTELLGIRDPNVNARFHPKKNSEAYLRRLCEVNYITAATPSLHNDEAVFESLAGRGYPDEAVRDWSATGCVEPTLSGQHMGHTGGTMFNMVAAVEMALNNGRHPLMRWEVGPETGDIEGGALGQDFEAFFDAFAAQLDFLAEQSTAYNNLLGEAHARLRPTPLLSAFTRGCLERGRDVTAGGARYNSSGVACIGLADVTDSLMAVKTLVYDQERVTLEQLRQAVADDFEGHDLLRALVRNKVPLFGSGDADALDMANRVARLAHDLFDRRENTRGGPYRAGFWSMSNHVAFGTLTGALPSGRRAGKAFTPGLTPQPGASPSLLDNLRDVAGLDPRSMPNNIAFNVKVVPRAGEPHRRTVETMAAYARAYFDLGGMQMQLNVVTSEMLRDAVANPEHYRNLLVRISGYNAYFVTLNRDMQVELIERSEYGL